MTSLKRHARLYLLAGCGLAFAAVVLIHPAARAQGGSRADQFRRMSIQAETTGLAEPFTGITTSGTVEPGLFAIRSTGVSTRPVRQAAEAFLASLDAPQRAKTMFPVDDDEWRKWMNPHFYVRQGVSFAELNDAQRERAFALMGAGLSARGLKLTRDIMRLNHTLGELSNNNFEEYGEGLYHLTVMGTPSEREPWGWQLDGHHAVINYFVLGDQVVMTPAFWGSEPTVATSGKFAGTRIMEQEQEHGLAMVRALTPAQRAQAVIQTSKPGNNILAQAFSDNLTLDYAGVRASTFSAPQRQQLLRLVGLYVNNLREPHARVHLSEVERHLDDTYFAWIGGMNDDSVFYYRVHSPVILLEFDHETPVGLRHLYPNVPYREHIHSVVRTPNGNDYGKDLLRQHYAQHPHGR
jgi:hypothetical protein